MFKNQIILVLLIIVTCAQSAKILGLFPFPSKSHHIIGSALMKELALRGHEVTMISPFPSKEPTKNYKDINIDGMLEQKEKKWGQLLNPNTSYYERTKGFISNINMIPECTMASKGMQEFLKRDEKFDVVVQFWGMTECMLGIGHKLNASTIAFSVIGATPFTNYITGNPNPYAYVPHIFSSYTDQLSFMERILNTFFNVLMEVALHYLSIPNQQRQLTDYFPDAPPIEELVDNVDIVLVNSHYATETPRPYLPNVIQIGGFHLQEKTKLDTDLQTYLDSSKHGVIFFSFGSNIKTKDIPSSTIDALLKSFAKLKYQIVWKFDEELPYTPSNVRISKWLPQRAILAHPSVKAFITHGGLGSTVEAVFHGVPMICVPFFGDQMKNTKDSVANGFAIKLELDDITEASMGEAIHEIIDNPKYSDKIKLRSDLYQNQETNPMDRAIFWIEHVVKHKGAKHMKARAAKIPWYQYMLLDVMAFLITVLLAIFGVLFLLFKIIFKLCCKKNKKVKIN